MKNNKEITQRVLSAPPFKKDGSPTLVTSILATLLHNIPLTKEEILAKLGAEHSGKSRGYLSNHFAELRNLKFLILISELLLESGHRVRITKRI